MLIAMKLSDSCIHCCLEQHSSVSNYFALIPLRCFVLLSTVLVQDHFYSDFALRVLI